MSGQATSFPGHAFQVETNDAHSSVINPLPCCTSSRGLPQCSRMQGRHALLIQAVSAYNVMQAWQNSSTMNPIACISPSCLVCMPQSWQHMYAVVPPRALMTRTVTSSSSAQYARTDSLFQLLLSPLDITGTQTSRLLQCPPGIVGGFMAGSATRTQENVGWDAGC
jgi:hypothetical protein